MRHQTSNAAITVKKRVNPDEAVMRCRRREYGFGLAEAAIDLLEAFEEARYGGRADRDVIADLDITVTQFAGDYFQAFLRSPVFDPQQIVGQQFAEAAMDLTDGVSRECAAFQIAAINPLLDRDVRFRFELEVALLGVLAVVVLKGALDVDWVRIVPFD